MFWGVLALCFSVAMGLVGCGGRVLELVPEFAVTLFVVDVGEAMEGDPLGGLDRYAFSIGKSLAEHLNVSAGVSVFGAADKMVTVGSENKKGISIYKGDFPYDHMRGELETAGAKKGTYREYEVWDYEGLINSTVLVEEEGYILFGNYGDVRRALKASRENSGLLLQEDEDQFGRVVVRAGSGLVLYAERDCSRVFSGRLRACDGFAVVLNRGKDDGSVRVESTFVFRNERSAWVAADSVGKFFDLLVQEVGSFDFDEIEVSGEFVEVDAWVDAKFIMEMFPFFTGRAGG